MLKPDIIQKLRKKNVVVSVIPKGCTQYLQVLDTSIFSIFKNHYQTAADEYIDLHGSRSKIKLSAKQQRILCTRLTSTAWNRTQNSVDFASAFRDIGYTWVNDSPITLQTLPGFVFDPTVITSSTINGDENEGNEEHGKKKMMIEEDKDLHIASEWIDSKMASSNGDYPSLADPQPPVDGSPPPRDGDPFIIAALLCCLCQLCCPREPEPEYVIYRRR